MSAMSIAQKTLTSGSPANDPRLLFEVLKGKYEGLPEVEEMLQDPELTCHFIKPKSKKATPPPEERRGVINEHKCDARVWKEKPRSGGLGYDNIQCSSKKVDGCDGLCKKHFKLFNEGKLWLGKVTEERPKDPVHPTAGPKMWSTDEDGNEVEKERKRKTSPKKSSPKKKKEKKEKKEKKSFSEEELLKMLADVRAKEQEAEEEEPVKEEEPVEKDPEPEPEPEPEAPVESEDEDEDEVKIVEIDGVEYQHNTEDGRMIRTDDFTEVGTWNDDTGEIDFDEDEDE